MSEVIEDFDVLIVGAGPVGLALSIELGQRGIRCLVVERNVRVGLNPRAKTTNVRTREHLRRWGIAEALRAASPMPPGFPSDIVFATRLSGPLLARFEDAFNTKPQKNDLYSEPAQWVPQFVLEEVLRQHAASLPAVTLRFSTALTGATEEGAVEEGGGVLSTLTDLATGEERPVRSRYLVGADGARSRVRDLIGAVMTGDGGFSRNINIMFRAPQLAAMHQHGPAIMYWNVNEEIPSLMGPMDRHGLWYFIATKVAGDLDPAEMDPKELIQRGAGLRFDMEIVGTDPWVAHRLVADSYAKGRMFLAGDACHLHPPFGGFGLNLGVGDAVDLGWKMAATLQGWGGPALLASYQTERRPIHERTIGEAIINYASLGNQLSRPGLEDPGELGDATRAEVGDIIRATKIREFKTLGIVLGYRYADSPIVVDDGSAPPQEHFQLYVPSAHPGCLAPHLWLADGSSLYDHFGLGFTLLVTGGDGAEARAFAGAAEAAGLPLTVAAPADSRLRARYAARFALIRPDQHVAWRGDAIPADVGRLLRHVTGGRAESRAAAA